MISKLIINEIISGDEEKNVYRGNGRIEDWRDELGNIAPSADNYQVIQIEDRGVGFLVITSATMRKGDNYELPVWGSSYRGDISLASTDVDFILESLQEMKGR